MPSSSGLPRMALAACVGIAVVAAHPPDATAEPAAEGFAVDRLYPSAAGGGWFVMDTLDMHGELGGAAAVTSDYARNPLEVRDPRLLGGSLAVVSNEATIGFGFAATYHRFRLSLDLSAPLALAGDSGTAGGYAFTSPAVGLGSTPDLLPDPRIGVDVRILGAATSPFRLGLGAQLFVPSSPQADYTSDGTYRAMLRVLFAGDAGGFTYAGHVGVHIRPVEAPLAPEGPDGSELLFGFAAGDRFRIGSAHALVIGPEVFGESALRSLFGATTTGVEALMTARLEGTGDQGPQLRVKLGTGGGLDPHFGAPEWRAVLGFEVSGRAATRSSPP